ncbi:hypothetical protein PAHAL_3G408000 [Panicum hallii]|uniref:Uncharacterized protein n=2 Tax=Panicum hallii TaxID=206008 RepID=A0A2T8KKV4_9POAL|nr:hypothetical protein PAHAL_3G408000 [Panicum hallii]
MDAPDSMDAVELAPEATDAEELALDSMEAPEEDALDSMETTLEAPEELAPDSLASEEVASEEFAALASLPESLAPEEIAVPKSFPDFVPDSLELDSLPDMVPDSMEPESQGTLCKRCNTIHGDNDVVACRLACREASRGESCRLVHRDYNLAARILDDQDKSDCLIYIPDVDKLQISGETILVPEHVQNKLDEQRKMKKRCKQRTIDNRKTSNGFS